MGRKRKGRAISGWLVIDKPAGITSTAVVNKVRWALQAQKAGHAGTLDPAATGVLAVALGEATKTVPFITDALKCYRFMVRLGQATTTDDAEGAIIATSEQRPTDAEIDAALVAFRGDIQQVPPQFSAVKVDGERAYDIARAGDEMELAARPLMSSGWISWPALTPIMSSWKWSVARVAMCALSRAIWGPLWAVTAMSHGCAELGPGRSTQAKG